MKTYIKPNTSIITINLQNQLLTISGEGNQLTGGSNGDYSNSVTLGGRRGGFWDDEDDEY